MAETHEAEIRNDNNRKIIIEDLEPLRSAKLFKYVSDAVWSRKPEDDEWAIFGVKSNIPPQDALENINEIVAKIDSQLVLAGNSKDMTLSGPRGESVTIPARELVRPNSVSLTTYIWDERYTGRSIESDGKFVYAHFTDGHVDYARELRTNYKFTTELGQFAVSYVMQRRQYDQAYTTDLHANVWFSGFAETGYEGATLNTIELTEARETDVLNLYATIGGVSLEEFEG